MVNKPLQRDFSIAKADEMGSLFVTLTNADSTTIVQLLQSEKEIVRQVRVEAGRADFYYLKPGKYFLRCFFDTNGNNQWDTGDYEQRQQPEAVYYYPQAIEVRANWDTDQAWDLKQWPLTAQKPAGLRQATNKNEQPSAHRAIKLQSNENLLFARVGPPLPRHLYRRPSSGPVFE